METVVAVIVGAVVGFGGTALLQAQRHRREDVEAMRMRLGVLTAARSELLYNQRQLEAVIEFREVPTYLNLQDLTWRAHGTMLFAILENPRSDPVRNAYESLALTARAIDRMGERTDSLTVSIGAQSPIHRVVVVSNGRLPPAIQALEDQGRELRSELQRRERLFRAPRIRRARRKDASG